MFCKFLGQDVHY
uniref:Uncharacterized protein n=1 Tax=Arundo donax TaxID=35708 RepID=A0A0A9FKW3_ARUDO